MNMHLENDFMIYTKATILVQKIKWCMNITRDIDWAKLLLTTEAWFIWKWVVSCDTKTIDKLNKGSKYLYKPQVRLGTNSGIAKATQISPISNGV